MSDDVAVCRAEFLGNTKHSEVFQFKAPVGTKDGNFVLFLFGSLILDSHEKTRCRQCALEGNLISSWHFSGSRLPTLENQLFLSKGKSRHILQTLHMSF